MIETIILVPLMHGFPWQTLGSIEIRSFQSMGALPVVFLVMGTRSGGSVSRSRLSVADENRPLDRRHGSAPSRRLPRAKKDRRIRHALDGLECIKRSCAALPKLFGGCRDVQPAIGLVVLYVVGALYFGVDIG